MKEPFDFITPLVDLLVVLPGSSCIGLGWNDRSGMESSDGLSSFLVGIAFVHSDIRSTSQSQCAQKLSSLRCIMAVARTE